MRCSKIFGPTDGVADTKTKIGSTYYMKPGNWTIKKARIAFAGVVDAKSPSGILHVEPANSPDYQYAFGAGAGGAATSGVGPIEEVDMQIPVAGGTELIVYATMAEACKDLTVSLEFDSEKQSKVKSYISAVGDATADTELTKTMPAVQDNGKIIQIRVAYGNVVNAKAASGKLVLTVGGQDGPFEYAIGNGSGGATNSQKGNADVIDTNIPVTQNQIVYAKLTFAENTVDTIVSMAVGA